MSEQAKGIKKWDREEVSRFVRNYSDTLIRYAFCFVEDSSVAEEIVLESMATFVVKSETKNVSLAYVYRIVRNKALDHLRFHKRYIPLQDVDVVGATLEENAVVAERNEILYKCLFKLPSDYKAALYLKYFEGLAVDDISMALRKSTKQIYNLLARGKTALKESMIKEGFDYEDL